VIKIQINRENKSIPKGMIFDLPEFCILTGRNGSGKTHLLEAISDRTVSNVSVNGQKITRIHYVGFNGLNPEITEQCDQNEIMTNVQNWWNQIEAMQSNYKQVKNKGGVFNNIITDFLPRYSDNTSLPSVVDQIIQKSKKDFEKITVDDVFKNINFIDITQKKDIFFSQCALIFKAYHTRKIKNEFAEFLHSKNNELEVLYLSEEEFVSKYGLPSWNLINDILHRANLPYKVSSPETSDYELPYKLKLIDKDTGIEIPVNDLSSGEKVLMSIALAIYNTQEGGAKPELLLLDEPDAPLHPQYSKLLIDTLFEKIVKEAGVNVIMTTHSPSTVAMAPDNSVYQMDRKSKTPHLISNAQGLSILTEGIEYLKVSYENRRQIFVESKYDVQYYQRLYNLLNRKHTYPYRLIFLEPHNRDSSCTDVIDIVTKLIESGNDLVKGVIDFDSTNKESEHIIVLGDKCRYSIENYILDPIYIGLALIRLGKKYFSDFNISTRFSYTDAMQLTNQECQLMVDTILRSLGIHIKDLSDSILENSFRLKYPKEFLLFQGHSYEALIKKTYPELEGISRGNGDPALKFGVLQVIEEYPQFLSTEINNTFEKLNR
jgi:ABC-type lipoprotein export system ATPase subunit